MSEETWEQASARSAAARKVAPLRRSSRVRQHGQQGFSLYELMAVVGISALILSLGLPSFTTTIQNSNMVSAANAFLGDLHYARDTAVARNQRVVMCASTTGDACNSADWVTGWLVFVDQDNDGALDAGEPIERTAPALTRLAMQAFNFGNSITYRPNGRAMGATVNVNQGAFLLCDDRGPPEARAVMVDFSGRPRVTHLARSGVTPPPCPAVT